jgi:hypothetical protein
MAQSALDEWAEDHRVRARVRDLQAIWTIARYELDRQMGEGSRTSTQASAVGSAAQAPGTLVGQHTSAAGCGGDQ